MTTLDYRINDADNHFNEPPDCFERYIDPSQAELAIRHVVAPDGSEIQLFAGRPSKFTSTASKQVTFSGEELENMLGDTTNVGVGRVVGRGRWQRRARRRARDAAQPTQPAQGALRRGAPGVHRGVPQPGGGVRQPRPPSRVDGRAGHRQGAHVPGRRPRHRVRVRGSDRRAVRQHPRLQPLDARRGRLHLRGPHVAPALHLVRRSGARGARARAGDGPGCERDPDQVRPRARWARQPLRRALARRSGVRPVLEHLQRGGRAARGASRAAPTTRSTAPTGRRTPTPSSSSSTPSSG